MFLYPFSSKLPTVPMPAGPAPITIIQILTNNDDILKVFKIIIGFYIILSKVADIWTK